MSVCRTCARTERPAARSQPWSGTSATLLLRVWAEDGDLRCRLLGAADPADEAYQVGTAQGVDAICDAVRAWLQDVRRG